MGRLLLSAKANKPGCLAKHFFIFEHHDLQLFMQRGQQGLWAADVLQVGLLSLGGADSRAVWSPGLEPLGTVWVASHCGGHSQPFRTRRGLNRTHCFPLFKNQKPGSPQERRLWWQCGPHAGQEAAGTTDAIPRADAARPGPLGTKAYKSSRRSL